MSKTAEEVLHFTIEGPYLTDLVRSLWADEGEPEKAIKILTAAFPTMQKSDVLAILIGEKKLTGDSNIGCNLVTDGVTESKHGNSLSVMSVLHRFRAKSEDRNDWLEMAVDRTTKIASPEGLVAIPTRRLRAYRKGEVTLEDFPYKKIETFSIRPDLDGDAEDDEEDDEMPEPIPEPESRPKPKPSPVIDGPHGWLSSDGKFYSCDYGGHVRLADDLGFDELQLEKKGWLKIQKGECFFSDRGLSQSQRDLLFDWYRERGEEIPWWFEDDYSEGV